MIRRRALLWLAGILPGALPVVSHAARGHAGGLALSELAPLFPRPAAAARLGEHCLQTRALARDPAALLADLGAARQADGQISAQRFGVLRAQDFEAGRVVVVGGWVMARSEVSACMLLAMAAGARA